MKKELDILIIEDVAHDAEFIEAELREAGLRFRTRRICTRESFLAALNDAHPDIILSDFTLPTFNALEALQLLRKLSLDIPFILVTGTRSEEVAVECIREGADDYILKVSLKRLPTSIKNALQKKTMERASLDAEAALRRSEEQYRLIAENTRDLISLVDIDGCFLYASPSHRTSLGYPPEELSGTQLIDLVHPEDRAASPAPGTIAPPPREPHRRDSHPPSGRQLPYFRIDRQLDLRRAESASTRRHHFPRHHAPEGIRGNPAAPAHVDPRSPGSRTPPRGA
ncbi:MAG: response regulator [Verrucomicrobia bacterium]|nr:response regulator [Verrucomicrobiota bacterium]